MSAREAEPQMSLSRGFTLGELELDYDDDGDGGTPGPALPLPAPPPPPPPLQRGFTLLDIEACEEPPATAMPDSHCVSSLHDLLAWPEVFWMEIASSNSPMHFQLLHNLFQKPFRLMTDYSGCGGPEMAMDRILSAALKLGFADAQTAGVLDTVVCYRAREINPSCRKVLIASAAQHGRGPLHVFGDILEGLPRRARRELADIGKRVERDRKAGQRSIARAASRGKAKAKAVKKLNEQLAITMRREVQHTLGEVRFAAGRKQKCFRCGRLCSVTGKQGVPTLVVAGVTCVDWSRIGLGKGCSGPSYIVFCAWALQILADMPELVIVECVQQFDLALLEVFKHKYTYTAIDFAPLNLGFPSERRRRYMILALRESITQHIPGPMPLFANLFFKPSMLSCDTFCTASEDDMRDDVRRSRCQHKRARISCPTTKATFTSQILSGHQKGLLRRWLDVVGHLDSGFVNVSQSPEFMGGEVCVKSWAPTLIRNSVLYSLKERRVPTVSTCLCLFPLCFLGFQSFSH